MPTDALEDRPGPGSRSRATWLVLAALVGGLLLGAASARLGDGVREPLLTTASLIGGLWLDALKMTVIPLIIALLVTGIVSGTDHAKAGGIAGRSFLWFVLVLTASAIFGGLVTPVLLEAFPLAPQSADQRSGGQKRLANPVAKPSRRRAQQQSPNQRSQDQPGRSAP